MTAKALELLDQYIRLVPEHFGGMDKELAKQCAIVCVDELIKQSIYWGGDTDSNTELKELKQVKQCLLSL